MTTQLAHLDWLSKQVLRTLDIILPQSMLNWREERYYVSYGEVELHLLPFLCNPKRDAIDIGANEGCYVHLMKRLARHVDAYEPNPELVKKLRHKFSGNVSIHNVAVSNKSGRATLHTPMVDGISITGCATVSTDATRAYVECSALDVKVQTLDEIYTKDVAFIKIDVEGHEEAVLLGAKATIERCRPAMLVEIDERLAPGGLGRIEAYFTSLGYQGYFAYRRQLLPLSAFVLSDMQRADNLPDLTAKLTQRKRFGSYIYNFIFLPKAFPAENLAGMKSVLAQL